MSDRLLRTQWIYEIRYTWVVFSLLSVLPAVVIGTALPAMLALMAVILLGAPALLVAALLIKDSQSRSRLMRRVVVMFLIAATTVGVVLQADKLTPAMARPIAEAVTSFKQENGIYPEDLDALIPKFLPKLPPVRLALVQPDVIYHLKNGKPYLAVPSAAGDAFSTFEYIFEDARWMHHD